MTDSRLSQASPAGAAPGPGENPAGPGTTARPRAGGGPRLRGLLWVTWRQHRAAFLSIAALFGGLLAYLLGTGLWARSAVSGLGLATCPPLPGRCALQWDSFNSEFGVWKVLGLLAALAVPAAAGVFAGGPLLAREFETGTFRFAWTQGTSRTRWVLAQLLLPAAAVTAAAAAFSAAFAWWFQPFSLRGDSLMDPQVFGVSGLAYPAWALAAFALGALAGAVTRRIVAGTAAGLAAWVTLAVVTRLWLRQHYRAPLTVHLVHRGQHLIPAHALIVREAFAYPDGRPMSPATASSLVLRAMRAGHSPKSVLGHAITQRVTYLPQAWYWHFQLIEAGWLLALAVAAGAATLWLAHRRAA